MQFDEKNYECTGSQFSCSGSGIECAIFLIKLQFAVQDTYFFKADENEFRGAGNVKRIETSAQITSMKSKSSAAEAIGRTKKKGKKGGKNRKKREKMKIEHRKRQKSAVVVHGSFDISSLRS